MSVTVFRRPPRQRPPQLPEGELSLQEPPVLPEAPTGNLGTVLTTIPLAVGSSATLLLFVSPGQGGGIGLLAVGLISLTSLTAVFGQVGRTSGERKRRMRGERRDYLRYLAQTRRQARTVATEQRAALAWRHPDPAGLWSVAMATRLWERRAGDADFAEIRLGTSAQRLAMTIKPMQTKPVEDLEPLCARALRRFIRAYTTVPDLPSAVFLRGFAQLRLRGAAGPAGDLARAVLAQLATFHSPDDLRVATCTAPDRAPAWDWVKWLPHAQHPSASDSAGPLRLHADTADRLEALLAAELADRPPFEAGAAPTRDEPYVVVVLDGVDVPAESRLAGAGYRNVVVLDVSGTLAGTPGRSALRLDVTAEQVEMVRLDRVGAEQRTPLCRPDRMSVPRAAALARLLAPYRLGGAAEVAEPMGADFDLGSLLGITDLHELDPDAVWSRTTGPDRLKVPIGIAEDGSRVELDIKESAQGGMGPHGLLIGATGSGKSELLRTLVLALALRHSSEILNFVLVDFKGGATFLGLDTLPHTSAVITNLADEATLVTRMQDALAGEMNRRQELLRRAGNYASLLDYERARAGGAALDPLPTLFVVVDEFSELLAAHPDFAELFIAIGRLGRSLGVHLLLASQRLDDGRMHKLESHLSYRIGLRTFSAMESRSVLGVPDAYQLPSAPGNGYLRQDVTTLVRFKAAYVSGRYRRRTSEQRRDEVRAQVVPFGAATRPDPPPALPSPAAPPSAQPLPADPAPGPIGAAPADSGPTDSGPTDSAPTDSAPADSAPADSAPAESLLQVAVSRLHGQGPPAHRVWLPPLAAPPSLDHLLPPLEPDPRHGLSPVGWAGRGGLVVPVAVVDRPHDQVRDLMMADLSGAGGHVGIAGGTQSGKSTVLRTLLAALALAHTPAEVQLYCLDFGGGTLATLTGLPHVGGVAGRADTERVSRTVAEVQAVLAARERAFAEHRIENMAAYRELRRAGGHGDDPFGDVFLVVDGWGSLRADFEELDPPIRQLAARGLTYGVHLVLTTNRWSDVHSGLRDQLGTRIELRLGDAIDSVIDMRAAARVPQLPGRGLTPDKLHFLAAVPRIDGRAEPADLAEATRALAEAVAECWSGPAAPRVRVLPAVLPAADLPAPAGRTRLPIGRGEADLEPVWHDFAASPHLTVLGDTGSGKTAALRLVAAAIPRWYRPDEAQVLLVDSRRALLDAVPAEYRRGFAYAPSAAADLVAEVAAELRGRLPGPDITPQQLQRRDWWTGPEVFVLVDDYDLLAGTGRGPLDALLDLLPQAADIGLHVVLTRNAAGSARLSVDPVVRRLQETNTPDLALSCPPNELPLLNGMRPRQLPPGRALLVTRRTATMLQVGWLDPTDPSTSTAPPHRVG